MAKRADAESDVTPEKRGAMDKFSAFRETDPKGSDDDAEDPESDEAMQVEAGKDIAEAHKSGDPRRIYEAHRHLFHTIKATGDDVPDDETGEDERQGSSTPGGSDSLMKRLKAMKG